MGLYEARRMIQHLPPQLRSGNWFYTILAAPPSGVQPSTVEEPWVMQQARWEVCREMLFTRCNLEAEGRISPPNQFSLYSAKEVVEELGGNLSNLRGVFLCRVSKPSGCCMLRTSTQSAQEAWGHILSPAAGHTPCAQSTGCNQKEACREDYCSAGCCAKQGASSRSRSYLPFHITGVSPAAPHLPPWQCESRSFNDLLLQKL